MERNKIFLAIGFGILALLLVAVVYGQFAERKSPMSDSAPVMRDTTRPVPSSEASKVSGSDTSLSGATVSIPSAPQSIDDIVSDIGSEASSDEAALSEEVSGETGSVNQDAQSVNDLSQFYDEKNLE